MKKKITIGDIAQQMGISKTAVSFVVNGKAKEKQISKSLEAKILEYTNKVGYRPNQFAQGLRTGQTKIIGMMVEDISDPFFSLVARYIEEDAYKKGYKIIYCSTENDTKKTKDLIQVYRNRQVDGYIMAPPPGIEKEINDLIDDKLPVVLFDRTIPGAETSNVLVNNYEAVNDAILHFISQGFRHIGMVTVVSEQIQMKDRKEGYTDALKRIKGEPNIKNVGYHEDKEKVIQEIEDFLKLNKHLDAVFFATNYIAESGLEAVRKLGLKIPEDIGVIVFDDHNLYRLFSPSISAISQPIKDIATNTIALMLQMLEDGNININEKKNISLKTSLIVRESSSLKSIIKNNETT
jgi:LacI family transcriptional regulator